MNQDDYEKIFETNDRKSKKLNEAFKQVSDIRKFEIELYWKRGTYFWALIAVAFAGYFAILSSEHIQNKYFLSLIVGSIGFVFTFGWFLSSRGSKYWQENWENHLDLLEDEITGPLYKTLLERPGHINLIEKLVTGPLSLSVSKINQWVSVFVVFTWGSLISYSIYKSLSPLTMTKETWFSIFIHFFIILIALLCCYMMLSFGKTHKDEHTPKVLSRKTKIIE